MADDELELDVNQAKGSKMTMILLIVLIVLVLIVGGVGAWFFMSKGGKSEGAAESHEPASKELKPLKYQTMVPEFIVNFGPGSKVRYLQIDLQIATRDEEALKVVNTYRPVIRNDILVLLSGMSFEQLKDRAGKERLQRKLLNVINKVVVEASHGGKKKSKHKKKAEGHGDEDEMIDGPIENVYFTSFIMQ